MLSKFVSVLSIIGAVATAHAAQTTCVVTGANPKDPNIYDQVLSQGQYDFDSGAVSVLLNGGTFQVTAHKASDGSFQIATSSIPKAGQQPVVYALAIGRALPISLIDGSNKLMVNCR